MGKKETIEAETWSVQKLFLKKISMVSLEIVKLLPEWTQNQDDKWASQRNGALIS